MQRFEHGQVNRAKSIPKQEHPMQLENYKCFAAQYASQQLEKQQGDVEVVKMVVLNEDVQPYLDVGVVGTPANYEAEAGECQGLVHAELEKGNVGELEEARFEIKGFVIEFEGRTTSHSSCHRLERRIVSTRCELGERRECDTRFLLAMH